jgi:2-keto-4-pentenoate hydratase/2-oxohepta-3-ene-1,7-dioic acid hydratase in catechol pathway
MKLAVHRTYFGDRVCLVDVLPGHLIDLHAAYTYWLEYEGLDHEDATRRAASELASNVPDLLFDDDTLTLPRKIEDWVRGRLDDGELEAECAFPDDPARLASPVGRPTVVWGMTGNYPRTNEPAGDAAPERRRMTGFLKSPSAIAGARHALRYPAIAERVDPEVELAVVIGRRCHELTEAEAMSAVVGYVVFCDTGSRDISALDNNRMDRAKGFDTFALIGPALVTKDEIRDPHDLGIRFWINGELTQDGTTAQMGHTIPEQLAWLTQSMTLRPGDVLSTGTPPGVRSIRPGDRIRGEIDGLGAIESDVVAHPTPRLAIG